MAGITDIIEEFLKTSMESEESLQISRNQLAQYFSCAPSQINYVLTTRFSPSRGYIVQSRRGGSGYITIVKLSENKTDYLDDLLKNQIGLSISQNKMRDILENMASEKIISAREARIVFSALSDKTLPPSPMGKDSQRAMMLKSVIKQIMLETK